jgi:hypothetical protein
MRDLQSSFFFIVHHDDLLQADVMVRAAKSYKIIVSVQG